MPLVSVLITVYNREDYLAPAVESVLGQSFQDFELIIVDDCSTDRSVEIARRYQSDPRVRVHVNERNLGDYPNRNRAAELAKGQYLKYLDAVDILYSHSLEFMVSSMRTAPAAALGVCWGVADPPRPYPFTSSPREVYLAHFLGRSVLGAGPSGAIMRHDAFSAAGGFSGRQFIGDDELFLSLAHRSPVVSLPPALVWCRKHEGQQTVLEQGRPEILTVRYRLECRTLESTHLLEPAEKRLAGARLRYRHGRQLLSMALKAHKPLIAWRLWRDAGLNWMDVFRCLHPRGTSLWTR